MRPQRDGRLRAGRARRRNRVRTGEVRGPGPAYWCTQSYAICNPDVRGVVDSEGDSVLWDRQEGRDCHDLVEWLARQLWCSGKAGISGTSYLAVFG
ncbi:CocE/NonD family hydrolase [Umezawaea sp. Da 62-37]|uniref:CocE/NonD family hydrolase n=1 Tax=Umezawaea sp. Da 62-37 TaxID=3075927 RepID=UPI0028F72075|nr:CocE/NonD family hydrolase [Umezawaea sp. Da 62-37]WNV82987.1 CocE/NonD family hydrolase [Umezawaea sp. Da 62-37]